MWCNNSLYHMNGTLVSLKFYMCLPTCVLVVSSPLRTDVAHSAALIEP